MNISSYAVERFVREIIVVDVFWQNVSREQLYVDHKPTSIRLTLFYHSHNNFTLGCDVRYDDPSLNTNLPVFSEIEIDLISRIVFARSEEKTVSWIKPFSNDLQRYLKWHCKRRANNTFKVSITSEDVISSIHDKHLSDMLLNL